MRACILALLIWTAFGSVAEAQINCDITLAEVEGDTSFISTSLSCFDNCCTASILTDGNTTHRLRILFKRSNDGGKTWMTQDPGLRDQLGVNDNHLWKVQQIDSLNVIGIGDTALVLRTFDAGKSWHRQVLPIAVIKPADVDFANRDEGLIVMEHIFTTSNGGDTWKLADFQPPYLTSCRAYGGGKFRGMSYDDGRIFSTSDNWKTVDSTQASTHSVPSYQRVIGAARFGVGDTIMEYGNTILPADLGSREYALIIRSVDAGKSWTVVFEDTLHLRGAVTSMSRIDRDTIVAGCGFGRSSVLMSFDRGLTWRFDTLLFKEDYNPTSTFGIDLNTKGNIVATMGLAYTSLIYGEISPPANVETYSHIPYYSYLYPNPVSENLYIVSQDRNQPIFVYDMLGREVEQGMLDANGKCTLNVSKLTPSIYVVMLQHGGQLLPVSRVAVSR